MYEENNENEEHKDERNICPGCGLRQYGKVCANCNLETESEPEEEDPDKRKEDEYDEYDWRERR